MYVFVVVVFAFVVFLSCEENFMLGPSGIKVTVFVLFVCTFTQQGFSFLSF